MVKQVLIDLDDLEELFFDLKRDLCGYEGTEEDEAEIVNEMNEWMDEHDIKIIDNNDYELKKKEIVKKVMTMKEAIAAKKAEYEVNKPGYITIYVEEGGYEWSKYTRFQMRITPRAYQALDDDEMLTPNDLIHNKENDTYDYEPTKSE
jgi:hypothetical protein